MLFLTRFTLVFADWRGYLIAGFSIVWIANIYMSLFGRLRLAITSERQDIDVAEKMVEKARGRRECQAMRGSSERRVDSPVGKAPHHHHRWCLTITPSQIGIDNAL